MLTFVYDENWKGQAEQGAHDDLVMALAIAHYIRPQQTMQVAGEPAPGAAWTKDMWEDYYAATRREREYLIAKWGETEKMIERREQGWLEAPMKGKIPHAGTMNVKGPYTSKTPKKGSVKTGNDLRTGKGG